jgi:hypothetical protein
MTTKKRATVAQRVARLERRCNGHAEQLDDLQNRIGPAERLLDLVWRRTNALDPAATALEAKPAPEVERDRLRGELAEAMTREAAWKANAEAARGEVERVTEEATRVKRVAIRDLHREHLEHTPAGTKLCYWTPDTRTVVVLGSPTVEDHNCDAMGCGTFSHVLERIDCGASDAARERAEGALAKVRDTLGVKYAGSEAIGDILAEAQDRMHKAYDAAVDALAPTGEDRGGER